MRITDTRRNIKFINCTAGRDATIFEGNSSDSWLRKLGVSAPMV